MQPQESAAGLCLVPETPPHGAPYSKDPRCTILVVDDEASARYALKRVFDRESRVVEASSVAEARTAIERTSPDIILLDYSMPAEDGMVLLRELQEMTVPPAVIMLTAHVSEQIAVKAMDTGASGYLSKPYDLRELRIAVSKALTVRDRGRQSTP